LKWGDPDRWKALRARLSIWTVRELDFSQCEVQDWNMQLAVEVTTGDGGFSHPSMGENERKRPRREELHDLLLEAGREVVQQEGIETAPSNLTFRRVFEHVERKTGRHVTNASVIRRVWENQADFQADVLMAIAQDEERPEVDLTLQAVSAVLKEVDLTTVESRLYALQELCRNGGAASSGAIANSPSWSLWISVLTIATTTSHPEQRQRIRAALAEGYESVTEFWERIYGWLTEFLGFRMREPRTIRQFTVAVTALSEGYSLREHVDGNIEQFILPTGQNGEDQEWTLYGAGLEALAHRFIEPDPGFTPSS
jgi:hypothetical protein